MLRSAAGFFGKHALIGAEHLLNGEPLPCVAFRAIHSQVRILAGEKLVGICCSALRTNVGDVGHFHTGYAPLASSWSIS